MTSRKAFFYLILLILQIALAEGILQAYYRIINGDYLAKRVDLPIFLPDPHRVYRVQSNLNYQHHTNEFSVTYNTDNFGFRAASPSKETSIKKPDGTYRIMFLGPSFNFGTANNYEDTFIALIGNGLVAPNADIDVINVGTPAQPPGFQLCWLQALGHEFQPDMIVQTVYGSPLLVETSCDMSGSLPIIKDGRLYTQAPSFRLWFIAKAKQSAIVFYTWYLYQAVFAPDKMEKGLGTEFYREGSPDTVDAGGILGPYNDYIDFVKNVVGDQVKIAFLYIPTSYVVHPEDRGRYALKVVSAPDEIRKLSARIESLLAENSIIYIDPTDALVDMATNNRMYYFLDIHFTAAGNKVLADLSIPVLQRLINE
ncbi:MAG: hypothetical protein BMS9Abin33_0419 [Gammaproteobacteria bacterium]|nr:MAG: hypothetical protein BMS9Abin33_0419 [Gammaproteobacteria bacterium]